MAEHCSGCPVARALDWFGDRWTLLVVRDLMRGASRFKDFVASPEGIPTNLLSDRLARLVEGGLAEKVPAADGSKRLAYRLTARGEALRPVLAALEAWASAWEPGGEKTHGFEADAAPPLPHPRAAPKAEDHFADLG